MADSPTKVPLQILVVDDEPSSREALLLCVEQLGHRPRAVESAKAALSAAESEAFDLALVDLRLGADSGLDLVSALVAQSPWLRVAVITAHGSIESAVEAIKRDAVDYLTKPVSPVKLEAMIRQITTVRDLELGIERLKDDLVRAAPPARIKSSDPAMLQVYAIAERAAQSDATILIRGESGTGKGVLARAIHDWSPRRARPFSVVNTPSLSRELLESELFGHVKGAFTGAVRSRPGRISRTEGGTLFLDEMGALPAPLQPKLLRVLQDGTYERVGGDETLQANVRWIVATNLDLEKAVEKGDFRQDLYFRIRVIEIHMPPLRERPSDILPLAEGFLAFFAARYNRPEVQFSDAAREALASRQWPGNVRELQNAIERAVILARGSQIGVQALPPAEAESGSGTNGTPMISLEEAERRHIEAVLAAAPSGKAAAKVLGISTTTLWRRRRKHDV